MLFPEPEVRHQVAHLGDKLIEAVSTHRIKALGE
jgi:hypothetical protein